MPQGHHEQIGAEAEIEAKQFREVRRAVVRRRRYHECNFHSSLGSFASWCRVIADRRASILVVRWECFFAPFPLSHLLYVYLVVTFGQVHGAVLAGSFYFLLFPGTGWTGV